MEFSFVDFVHLSLLMHENCIHIFVYCSVYEATSTYMYNCTCTMYLYTMYLYMQEV